MNALANPPQGDLNFSQQIDKGLSPRQMLVVLALSLLVLFDGMNNQEPALIAHDLTRDLGLPLSSFGLVFSSGVVGSILGALLVGPPADSWLGRKRALVIAMALVGGTTVLAAHSSALFEFIFLRFLTGFGLGAAMPNIISLAVEFSPSRLSRQIVSLLFVFLPLGSVLGGLLAHAVMPRSDWRMLLDITGATTLAFTAISEWIVPESVEFLMQRKRDPRRVSSAIRKLFPSADAATTAFEDSGACETKSGERPIANLFRFGLWKLTLTLWLIVVLVQAILFFILGWIPALLVKSGMSSGAGMDAAVSLGLGGAIGTAAQGWLTARFGIYKVMFPEIGLYIAAMLTLPLALGHPVILQAMLLVLAVTFYAFLMGAVLLAVESYPRAAGSTAMGWALGIGRVGGSSAPALVGFLLAMGWTPSRLFIGASVLGMVTSVALIGLRKFAPRAHDPNRILAGSHTV